MCWSSRWCSSVCRGLGGVASYKIVSGILPSRLPPFVGPCPRCRLWRLDQHHHREDQNRESHRGDSPRQTHKLLRVTPRGLVQLNNGLAESISGVRSRALRQRYSALSRHICSVSCPLRRLMGGGQARRTFIGHHAANWASRRAGVARPGRARPVQVERPAGRTTWTGRARSGCLRCAAGSRGRAAGIPQRPGPGRDALAAGGGLRVTEPEVEILSVVAAERRAVMDLSTLAEYRHRPGWSPLDSGDTACDSTYVGFGVPSFPADDVPPPPPPDRPGHGDIPANPDRPVPSSSHVRSTLMGAVSRFDRPSISRVRTPGEETTQPTLDDLETAPDTREGSTETEVTAPDANDKTTDRAIQEQAEIPEDADLSLEPEPPEAGLEVDEPGEVVDVESTSVANRLVGDLAQTGFQELVWQACELAAASFAPHLGLLVQGVGIAADFVDALKSLNDGNGFNFKIPLVPLGGAFSVDLRITLCEDAPPLLPNIGVEIGSSPSGVTWREVYAVEGAEAATKPNAHSKPASNQTDMDVLVQRAVERFRAAGDTGESWLPLVVAYLALDARTGRVVVVHHDGPSYCPLRFEVVPAARNGCRDVVAIESRGPYTCPCCGHLTLARRGANDQCDECDWYDDGQDNHDADVVRGGRNRTSSLNAARAEYVRRGGKLGAHRPPPTLW
jgi:hypothetical protein